MLIIMLLKKFLVCIIFISIKNKILILGFFFFVEVTSGTSYEANKEKAKDSDNPVGERIGAGFSAVGDKIEEKSHKAQAAAHKEAM